ncbi:MAG: LysR family transcriptional regulator, partial [Rhodobiaceae bacterium]|nr:LysR family transcriptional regulator [Rhodobiaceae bacterium]
MARGRYELNQLRCFVAVAEELNFRRAAERLAMTQPPLSRQIKLLEHGIGLTLLERSNRAVRLTPAGESFLVSATDLLQRAEHAVLTARQAERGEIGAIAMGFVPSAALEFVPRIVDAMSEKLPQVSFNPTEMMSYEIVEA